MKEMFFLTSNSKKASDFASCGLPVKEFHKEVLEIDSPQVDLVALYKARDAGLDNILVEDTSLEVEGAGFPGTHIKHVYEEIRDNAEYDGRRVLWKIAICAKKSGFFYVATAELKGVLKYPGCADSYHFDRHFAIEDGEGLRFYDSLPREEKVKVGPRYVAINKLINAFENGDFSDLSVYAEKDVGDWMGSYQIEKKSKKLTCPK